MKQTISVRFYARKERSTQSGLTPIVMRIAVGEQRLNIGTKLLDKKVSEDMNALRLKFNKSQAT